MGALDHYAKDIFAQETAGVTRGAVTWQLPPEIGLFEVRLDGILLVRNPSLLSSLKAPWSSARPHDEIALELKMVGDHRDVVTLQRALLRRQVRQVQRVEATKPPWLGEEPVWIVASGVPGILREIRTLTKIAPGCYAVGPSSFDCLWIAANELPLAEELVPFLIARSGSALVEFARWVVSRRPAHWFLRMVQLLPMSPLTQEELLRTVPQTDDPEICAAQRRVAQFLLERHPDLQQNLIQKGIDQGIGQGIDQGLQPLVHLFERRLARPLTDREHRVVRAQLRLLGADHLGDLVLDLSAEALAAWLASSAAAP